jgi:predicted O-methyltransferase YrrM
MRIPAIILCLALSGTVEAASDAAIEFHLASMRVPGKMFANIEASEGAYLRQLVKEANAKRVLEIGTSTGYSGIWMALALRNTGGKLITIEIDNGRFQSAKENFATTGLSALVEQRLGDALKEVPKVDGPLDVVFIDAAKPDYLKYYEMVLPKMRKGGVIVAHNTVSHPRDMADFLGRIKSDPKVNTEIVTPGWQGFSISRVK